MMSTKMLSYCKESCMSKTAALIGWIV